MTRADLLEEFLQYYTKGILVSLHTAWLGFRSLYPDLPTEVTTLYPEIRETDDAGAIPERKTARINLIEHLIEKLRI